MKKEIVYTDKYALVLSDEQIKDVRPHKDKFHLEKGSFINQFPTYLTDLTECKLIIAHLPLSDAPILEGVPLLPSFSWSQQDDVNKLAYEQWKKPDYRSGNPPYIYGIGFYEGYNKAKEKYKYTEEDVRRAIEMGIEIKGDGIDDMFFTDDEIIERLQQPSRPTHFECEMVDFEVDMGLGEECIEYSQYPKTITNSQGYIELVGKYLNL
jgi:hypothetical protein